MRSGLGVVPGTWSPVARLKSRRVDSSHHYCPTDPFRVIRALSSPSLTWAMPGEGVSVALKPPGAWPSGTAPARLLSGRYNLTCLDCLSSSLNPLLPCVCPLGICYLHLPNHSENLDSPYTLHLPCFPNLISHQLRSHVKFLSALLVPSSHLDFCQQFLTSVSTLMCHSMLLLGGESSKINKTKRKIHPYLNNFYWLLTA